MMVKHVQRPLSPNQLEAFYHSDFVSDQIAHFQVLFGTTLAEASVDAALVLDIGGGVGFFAERLRQRLGVRVRVVDVDPISVTKCMERGVEASQADAAEVPSRGDEAVICFNLILHHLVGMDSESTRALQVRALARWRRAGLRIFVNEYIYESYIPGFAGALIFYVTSSRLLSAAAKFVSRLVPALRANTFGTGVRFRGANEWIALFREAGFVATGHVAGREERVDLPLRLLLIRSIKRSSFVLDPA